MTMTQRTFVASHTAGPDDAGWRFVTPTASSAASEADRPPNRRLPSLSWRLRH
jgi:hypothetical protein